MTISINAIHSFLVIFLKIDVPFGLNIMQDYLPCMLPQEIVYEIISYVPEYGFLVNLELHGRSLCIIEVSAYCDFLRYCARLPKKSIETCVSILTYKFSGPNETVIFKDIMTAARNYLEKNKRELVFEYLRYSGKILRSIVTNLGFVNVGHWSITTIFCNDDDDCTDIIYENMSYYDKVIGLYTLMILRDSGFMSKKEFDAECSKIVDIDTILEIILAVYPDYEHIFNISVRHFRSRMSAVIERIKLKQAVVDRIVCGNVYNSSYIVDIMKRLYAPKIKMDVDTAVLREVRDKLMSSFDYEAWMNVAVGFDQYSLFAMIESLADEE